jgi:hypothetical protein
MTKMYACHAAVADTDSEGWTFSRNLPTFYLHPTVQGILTEEAAVNVATGLINDILGGLNPERTVVVYATEVDV